MRHGDERTAFDQHSEVMLSDARERAAADVNLEFAHQWAMIFHTTPPAERDAAKQALRRAQSARLATHHKVLTDTIKAQRAAARELLTTKQAHERKALQKAHERQRLRLNPRQGGSDLDNAAELLLLRALDAKRQRRAVLPLLFKVAGFQMTGVRHILRRPIKEKPPTHDR